jgi:hypothetical protein
MWFGLRVRKVATEAPFLHSVSEADFWCLVFDSGWGRPLVREKAKRWKWWGPGIGVALSRWEFPDFIYFAG